MSPELVLAVISLSWFVVFASIQLSKGGNNKLPDLKDIPPPPPMPKKERTNRIKSSYLYSKPFDIGDGLYMIITPPPRMLSKKD